MDAGVPIKRPVAGISVGLVMEKDKFTSCSPTSRATRTTTATWTSRSRARRRAITGIQLDIKLDGVTEAIVRGALEQAKEGRLQILKVMLATLSAPRKDISGYAPRLIQLKINPEKIGKLIGPGGKMIRAIQEETGAKIDIEDDGTVSIASANAESVEAARRMVEGLTAEVKVGRDLRREGDLDQGVRRVHRDRAGPRRAVPRVGAGQRVRAAAGGRGGDRATRCR